MKSAGLATGKKNVEKLTGSARQLAGIKRYVLEEGLARGVRAADVWTGGGLSFTVLFDRGMDIGAAFYKGIPLAFVSCVGEHPHPAHYEREGAGWLRSFGGGLLTGCGLRNVGSPCELKGESLGLHGRISNTPAFNCSSAEEWRGDKYVLELSGAMREARLFGENLLLKRKISAEMFGSSITVEDTVENQARSREHLTLLHHINIGYPMLSPDSFLKAAPHKTDPRDDDAAKGLAEWDKCQDPVPNCAEQCFYHDIPADGDGLGRISMVNPSLGLELEVAFRKAELPFLTQWKSMAEGGYVVGLEPANCHVRGAAEEKAAGTLQFLEPGEKRSFFLRISAREI